MAYLGDEGMGASKRYKGKDCAYCGEPGTSSTNDHVVARSFFPDIERGPTLQLPQVAACQRCNNEKSALELYVGSSLLIGSRHSEASHYRREKIRPRLERNRSLWDELKLDNSSPRWIKLNGVFQRVHQITIDAGKVERLLEMIVKGLYRYHYGKPLPLEMRPDVQMIRPEAEAVMWGSVAGYFPKVAPRITRNLGRGIFTYACVQSPANDGFTAWVISMHGNIRLYGTEGSSDHWWCVTRPTPEALAAAQGPKSNIGREGQRPGACVLSTTPDS